MENRDEFKDKFLLKAPDGVVDIENFHSLQSLEILIIDIILPLCKNRITHCEITFCKPKLKILLDKIIRRYYIQARYEGITGVTRLRKYVIYG